MYKKIDQERTFRQKEDDILKLWDEKDIVKKNFNLNQDGEYFTFNEGPPTANGKPHIGHVITRAVKDIIPRYKVMRGYKVLRKGGWDTHGLPVELEVERQLKISGKKDIEKFGVEPFIEKCKESVFTYVNMWREMSEKVGFWLDMDNPYVTYHNDYIESVWWALKEIWDKGLFYKGFKVMPYCPRCGTGLASHEVAQGYEDVKDNTVIAKFKLKNEDKYMLAWTTTPWTLPSNVALTINKSCVYAEVKNNGEIYILGKELVPKVMIGEYEIIDEFKGEKLLGIEYEPLFNFAEISEGKAHIVVHGDYVTMSEGSGIVHTAPAYGEDDYNTGKKYDLAFVHLVDLEGKFVKEVTLWAGLFVKDADPKIIEELKNTNKLYKSEKFVHAYPHCWRCHTPLLYYPRDSWFIRMSSLREELLKNNDKINWYPDNVRTGRFGKFLENVIDWSISRNRYWGTPLPIWQCECGHEECIGSIKELKEKGINVKEKIELHKPYIDEVSLKCPKCGKNMKRVEEVIDCWFDSGSMPFAQHHYPFENVELFKDNFPADFISEAVDQTRGWFYSQHAIATTIFNGPAFKNCIVMGHVLDKDGKKMSKHLGNVIDPMEIINEFGADSVRWFFYTTSAPWVPIRFSKMDVKESQRKFLSTFWNVYSFYVLYAELDEFNPLEYKDFKSESIMDRWILSKVNSLIERVSYLLDHYDITEAGWALDKFVDELSNWYVRRCRGRYWGSELTEDKIGAYTTLYRVLNTLCKISAPFVPFMTEEIYQNLVISLDEDANESIHLCTWPDVDDSLIDKELEENMDLAYSIVKLGRSARNAANIKNRQPLSKMLVSETSIPEYYGDVI
ncbi:MAG: isoleucine--tRNA ligase, partial [Oscillospiraceae bacterium]|nr:isoleucine--tRNA ligase [Oscillospiraceae bacterium]